MKTVYYYRGWVDLLNQYAYAWDSEEPTHMVVSGLSYPVASGSVVIQSTLSQNTVDAQIIEEIIPTGGRYRGDGFVVEVTQSGWNYIDKVWPHTISILSAEWMAGTQHQGDILRVEVVPNTVIGAVTSGFTSGTQQFQVQQSVIDNTFVGALLHICDDYLPPSGYLGLPVSGYQGEHESFNNVGYVTAIDLDNLLITVQNPITRDFNGAGPTYVIQTVEMVNNIFIEVAGPYALGESKIGGSNLPAGYKMRLLYYNADGQNKRFSGTIETLY